MRGLILRPPATAAPGRHGSPTCRCAGSGRTDRRSAAPGRALDEVVELARLRRVRRAPDANSSVRLVGQRDDRLAAHRHDARARSGRAASRRCPSVLGPGDDGLRLEAPRATGWRDATVQQDEVGHPQPDDAVRVHDARDRQRAYLRDGHRRVGPRRPIRRVFVAQLIRPRRVDDADAVRSTPGSGGGSARICSACLRSSAACRRPLTRPVRSISSSSLPNFSGSASAASTMASAFSSVRRAMPVALAALSAARPVNVGQLAQPFCRPLLTLPLLRRLALDRLQRALDRDRLRQREILAVGVLGKFAAQDCVEVHDGDRDRLPAEQLRLRADARPPATSAARPDIDRVQQAQLVRDVGGERGDVAQVTAVALADIESCRRAWLAIVKWGPFPSPPVRTSRGLPSPTAAGLGVSATLARRLPKGVIAHGDANAMRRQLHHPRTRATVDNAAAGARGDAVELAPLVKRQDLLRVGGRKRRIERRPLRLDGVALLVLARARCCSFSRKAIVGHILFADGRASTNRKGPPSASVRSGRDLPFPLIISGWVFIPEGSYGLPRLVTRGFAR